MVYMFSFPVSSQPCRSIIYSLLRSVWTFLFWLVCYSHLNIIPLTHWIFLSFYSVPHRFVLFHSLGLDFGICSTQIPKFRHHVYCVWSGLLRYLYHTHVLFHAVEFKFYYHFLFNFLAQVIHRRPRKLLCWLTECELYLETGLVTQ